MEAIVRVPRAFWLATISGLVAQPYPCAAALQTQAAQTAACHEFTTTVMIGGQQQQVVGLACQQPDGRWSIVQGTPPETAAPAEPQGAYPYPEPYYPAPYYPYWVGPPFFVGGSFFIFRDRFGHFHRFDHRFDHRAFV